MRPGDYWALCFITWKLALSVRHAPMVKMNATNLLALDYVAMQELRCYDEIEEDRYCDPDYFPWMYRWPSGT